MGFATHKSRSINNVGTTREYRLNNSWNVLRIVFEVSVLNYYYVSSCRRNA